MCSISIVSAMQMSAVVNDNGHFENHDFRFRYTILSSGQFCTSAGHNTD